MTFASFKMVFDLSQIISLRWGEKLYRQDARIGEVFIVLNGKISLSYLSDDGDMESFKNGGFLGMTLGEELLFYKKPLYRETALCESRSATLLSLTSKDLMTLGDSSFPHKNINSEIFQKDMETMFE